MFVHVVAKSFNIINVQYVVLFTGIFFYSLTQFRISPFALENLKLKVIGHFI